MSAGSCGCSPTLPLDEIARLEALRDAEVNEAKKVLAREATALCHGAAEAGRAEATARTTFEDGALGDDLPRYALDRSELESGIAAFDLIARAGLAASRADARRLIRGGGGRLNDRAFDSEMQTVTLSDLTSDGVMKLSAGRKRHVIVTPV